MLGPRVLATVTIVVATVSLVVFSGYYFSADSIIFREYVTNQTDETFSRSIQLNNLVRHLDRFQRIANLHGGSRSVRNGFNASADYIVSELQTNTNYSISIQTFPIKQTVELSPPNCQQVSPYAKTYKRGVDFDLMTGSGSGNISGITAYSVGIGCESSDFNRFPAGGIALIRRGQCTFMTKVNNAIQYKAAAVIIYNSGDDPEQMGLFSGTVGIHVPVIVFSMTYTSGFALATQNPLPLMKLEANTTVQTFITRNVIADTRTGRPDQTIVIGSHLDSVDEGPGINDNGSGSSANLEIAIQMYKLNVKNANRIRFAWFGAEELGLLGSRHYVNSLNLGELHQIVANLNFDMLGSPNYFRGVYNATGLNTSIRSESEYLMSLFTNYFENVVYLPYNLTEMEGRSDYGPFIEHDIPAGGLFTGAEEIKSVADQKLYGGEANVPYDSCYHQACDTLSNVNQLVLLQMSRAAAYVAHHLALLNDVTFSRAAERAERPSYQHMQSTNGASQHRGASNAAAIKQNLPIE